MPDIRASLYFKVGITNNNRSFFTDYFSTSGLPAPIVLNTLRSLIKRMEDAIVKDGQSLHDRRLSAAQPIIDSEGQHIYERSPNTYARDERTK